MHSLLWFMLCCFVLEILNKTYFICEMLEWPAIKQTLQAPRFTLYLNFANNFKPAAPTPWAILLAQVHLQECRPTPAAHTGPQDHNRRNFPVLSASRSSLPHHPQTWASCSFKSPHLFQKKHSLGFPSSLSTPYLFQIILYDVLSL